MWNRDCGFVRVIDAAGKVVGVITDRDICTADQAMRRQPIHTTQPEDTAEKALATLKQFQVRLLLVIATNGTLKGVVSMNDIVLGAQQKEGPAAAAIVSSLAAICAHRPAKVAAV